VFWQDLAVEVRAFLKDYDEFQLLLASRPDLMDREMEPADSSGKHEADSSNFSVPWYTLG
jgi:hypothetical protein